MRPAEIGSREIRFTQGFLFKATTIDRFFSILTLSGRKLIVFIKLDPNSRYAGNRQSLLCLHECTNSDSAFRIHKALYRSVQL